MDRRVIMLILANSIYSLPIFIMVPAISHMIMDFGLASNRSETGYYTAPILGA